ncbi:MAG: DNA double-strand break repair nuclease NurA [archaeon GB-1867-035]|nr:DNA double-strand break repair nuclease NurA [Candidatus Culexmicrobium profundum]
MFNELIEALNKVNERLSYFSDFSVNVNHISIRNVDLRDYITLRDDEGSGDEEELTLIDDRYVIKNFSFSTSKPESVYAIDSSSLRILETDDGFVVAYRICIVNYNPSSSNYNVISLGPYLCYLSEWNKVGAYNMARELMNLPPVDIRSTPSIFKLIDRIRNSFERTIQKLILKNSINSLVLWDGSLTMGTIDTPKSFMSECIDTAFKNNNIIVGISKRSWLKTKSGFRIVSLLSRINRPCYIDIHDYIESKHPIGGRVYIAKFDINGPSLRVDIAAKPGINTDEVISMIATRIPLFNGYPEPLRLAHMYCYFTNIELLNLEAHALNKIDSESIEITDWRNVILYPY